MTKELKMWLWLSVILTIAGALLLYPIGTVVLNIIFIVIKIGMLVGLFVLLFLKKKAGFYLWVLFCIGAVIMTIFKWNIIGSVSAIFIISIIVDVLTPVVAYTLMKNRKIDWK